MNEVGVIAVWALASAALGTIPFTVAIPRALGKPDPRTLGTHNASVSNAIMSIGRRIGVAAALMEGAKGVIAVLPMRLLGMPLWAQALCLLATVMATRYSPFLGFRGGQARTPGLWGLAIAAPLAIVILYGVWAVGLAITRSSSKSVDAAIVGIAPALGLATWSLEGLLAGLPFMLFYLVGLRDYRSEMTHFELLGRLSR